MDPFGQAVHRQFEMEWCWRGQAHGLDVPQEIISPLVKRHAVLPGNLLTYPWNNVTNAHQLCPTQVRINAAMPLTHPAHANDTHPHLFHLISSLPASNLSISEVCSFG
jgi:hypothetical protein